MPSSPTKWGSDQNDVYNIPSQPAPPPSSAKQPTHLPLVIHEGPQRRKLADPFQDGLVELVGYREAGRHGQAAVGLRHHPYEAEPLEVDTGEGDRGHVHVLRARENHGQRGLLMDMGTQNIR